MAEPLVYDPYAYEIHEDPYPTYKRLRDEAPVYENPDLGFYALSRFEDVWNAIQEWETYSSSEGVSLERGSGTRPPMIIAMDPPRQQQLRRLVSKAFTPGRIAALEPTVRSLTRKSLEPVIARGACDFIQDFAAKLPMDVISTMMGVPEADQDMLRGWADTLLHREEGRPEIPQAGLEASGRLARYFADLARRRAWPGDDLISALLGAKVDGERLTDAEIVGFCFLLVIAGNETTTKMLGNAIVLLDRHPDQRAWLVDSPGGLAGAVEEVVRYDNSTQMLARVLTRDVSLHGTTMRAGKKLLLLIGSANRDERAIARPDEFDVRREPAHLAFGHGVHVCLGASLARLEGRVALEEVLPRMPDYDVDPAGLVRVHSPNVRGYSQIPIRFRPRGW